MEELIIKIESDLAINKRCMEEEMHPSIRKMLDIWTKYDEELLAIIRSMQIRGEFIDNRSTKKSK